LAEQMAGHSKKIAQKIENLQAGENSIAGNLLKLFDDIGESLRKVTNSAPSNKGDTPPAHLGADNLHPGGGLSFIPPVAPPLLELLASAGLVIMLLVFMLTRREDLRNRLVRLVSHGRLTLTTRALDEAAHRISRYLVMQLTTNAGLGLAVGVGLNLIGVP